ncbi:MAG TPA: GtrA family protein [Marmoricola sp.]|nr:GtrA family protein [Marmoricola sp.]
MSETAPGPAPTARVAALATRARAALLSREVLSFLGVGGTGYVVDVVAFNWLRSLAPFAALDPTVSRTLAVVAAMVVTYLGNSLITWSGAEPMDRRREIVLFVVFNIVGFGFSVVALAVSHDLFGLTSRLDDNVSANVVGMALGTAFRFWSYRRFVFAAPAPEPPVAARTAV